ncbi:MAG TPA: phasin family protein [Thermoanaerobaculia bacterium]|nr:phasin family protein [Thermoanaerobaculia bacterium]
MSPASFIQSAGAGEPPAASAGRRAVGAARSLYWAGLGVLAEMGAEMGEAGRTLAGGFDRLVERGRPVAERAQRRSRQAADAADAAVERVRDGLRGLGTLVKDTVDYESRGLLRRLNVATHEDLRVLASRLDALGKQLDDLAAGQRSRDARDSRLSTLIIAGESGDQ